MPVLINVKKSYLIRKNKNITYTFPQQHTNLHLFNMGCSQSCLDEGLSMEREQILVHDDHSLVVARTFWNGSTCGVFNQATKQIEWQDTWHRGVAGVYNPDTQQVEWEYGHMNHCVAGVYNPRTRRVEWKTNWNGGVAGVWNEHTQQVEWRSVWHHGVGGVYNPRTRRVEWREVWNGGVAGYFDQDTGQVVWMEEWHHGVCIVHLDVKRDKYITCCSNITDWYDED